MSSWEKAFGYHKTGLRLLKMIHADTPALLPLQLIQIVLSVLTVYLNLFLTARFIDALTQACWQEAIWRAGLVIGVNLVFRCVERIIQGAFRGQRTRVWLLFYVWLRQKAFSLDYESLESRETVDRILYAERTSDMHGGLGMVAAHYSELLRSFLHLTTSLSLVFALCLSKVRGDTHKVGGFLDLLVKPGISLFLFGLALAAMVYGSVKVSKRYAQANQKHVEQHAGIENKLAYLQNNIFFNVSMGKQIRIFHMEDMLEENARKENQKISEYFGGVIDRRTREASENTLIGNMFTWLSYLLVAAKAAVGAITVGAFTQYIGAVSQFGSACTGLINSNAGLRQCCTYLQEFLEFMDQKNTHAIGTIPVEKRSDNEYELAFEDVSFRYPGSETYVLKHVNCKFNLKSRMAIVGPNGAGKTTFIKLLCRLYEPTKGCITLNGIDIRKYNETEYRQIFGVVFQDFKLFAFPVWENVAVGDERDDERIKRALQQADALSWARGLPQGLETWLYQEQEEGTTPSGGEAQKLALARALYRDAAFVILDEPTAALDPKAEAQIYEGFGRMVEGKTSIFISHRMSSCRFCDEILVFSDGCIVERGSHETLLKQDGDYARLWQAQAQYYT